MQVDLAIIQVDPGNMQFGSELAQTWSFIFAMYMYMCEGDMVYQGLVWHNIIVSETRVAISIFEESNITQYTFLSLV